MRHYWILQTDEIDELFNFSTDVDESATEFDAGELEQIEMLETYRSNLVDSAAPNGPQSSPRFPLPKGEHELV